MCADIKSDCHLSVNNCLAAGCILPLTARSLSLQLYFCVATCPSVCITFCGDLFICLSVLQFVSICSSVCLHINLWQSAHLFFCISIYGDLPICLSVYQSTSCQLTCDMYWAIANVTLSSSTSIFFDDFVMSSPVTNIRLLWNVTISFCYVRTKPVHGTLDCIRALPLWHYHRVSGVQFIGILRVADAIPWKTAPGSKIENEQPNRKRYLLAVSCHPVNRNWI